MAVEEQVAEAVSEQAYRRVALRDPDGPWELHRGHLREKPTMTFDHQWRTVKLGYQLLGQLDWRDHQVTINGGRVRRSAEGYYVPDLLVVPTALTRSLRGRSDVLETYDAPLPLAVEVWSPSTGGYDVDAKLPEYLARGDLEIWRVHLYERTLTAWRRQPDGTCERPVHQEGLVRPAALPGVAVALGTRFAD